MEGIRMAIYSISSIFALSRSSFPGCSSKLARQANIVAVSGQSSTACRVYRIIWRAIRGPRLVSRRQCRRDSSTAASRRRVSTAASGICLRHLDDHRHRLRRGPAALSRSRRCVLPFRFFLGRAPDASPYQPGFDRTRGRRTLAELPTGRETAGHSSRVNQRAHESTQFP